MKVFLTGGTGYLGDCLARELMDQEHTVTALARDPMRATSLAGIGVRVVGGDLLDESSWREHLEDCDALVHTAAAVKAWGVPPEEFDAMNIAATESLVKAAEKTGITKVVVTGSLFALGPSTPDALSDETALARPPHPASLANDYARTKAAGSRRLYQLQQRDSQLIQVFPTILVGPGLWTEGNSMAMMITRFNRGKIPGLVGSGDQVWNFLGVRDAARGHILALEKGNPGSNYILAGDNWTQRRFFEFVASELDRKPPRRALGKRLPLALARVSETWARLTGRSPFVTEGEVLLSHESWAFSGDRARRELGFEPTPMEDVLRETVAWLRDEIWPRESR